VRVIEQADAVVIGAGAYGLSTALWLGRLGAGRVVVLDRFEPGSQTSPRAAGMFKHIQADETTTALARQSADTIVNFEREFGISVQAVRSGSLLVAQSPEYAGVIEQQVTRSRGWGIEIELLDGAEAARFMPLLNPRPIQLAAFTPGDMYIETPADLLNAYRQVAEQWDVTIVGNTAVTGVETSTGHVTGVMTERGLIETSVLVNAAGAWAGAIGAMAGVPVAMAPLRHQLFITDPLDVVEPRFPIVRLVAACPIYVRPCAGGLMFGGFEPDPVVVDPADEPAGFSMDELPLDALTLQRLAGMAGSLLPVLRDATVRLLRGGVFTMTPDDCFLVGPVPELEGFWLVTGCNGSGFSTSPAVGRCVAEWIVQGRPSIDLTALAPSRFAGQGLDTAGLREAGLWQYTHYYAPLAE
jgi:glycine/D-amino acid oxidase-like deaminating enzyme